MLLSYVEIVDLVKAGVVSPVADDDIQPASIDVHLGDGHKVEKPSPYGRFINLAARESVRWIDKPGVIMLSPGEFVLSHTREVFDFPDNLCAEFVLKSSLARNGLEHSAAGWIDPGYNGSTLTLELKNLTRYHTLVLEPGMPIGQLKCFRVTDVPAMKSYRARGRYNGITHTESILP